MRPAGKGGSSPLPPPRFFGAAEGTCARPRRGAPGARSPSLTVRGPLTSRHAGAHHGAAGPGRCALGAPGRRALMSPRARGSRAALAQRKRGRAEKGTGLLSPQPPLPPGRPRQRRSARLDSRRRLASRARPCQTRAARRAGRPRGALARSPEPRARSPRGRSAPSAPAACRPVAAARPGGGGGVSRSLAAGRGEGKGSQRGNFWPSRLPRH